MAGKALISRYRFFPSDTQTHNPETPDVEFDECDVWAAPPSSSGADPKRPSPALKAARKPAKRSDPGDRAASSLPVKIPDWSKILGGSCRRRREAETDCGDDGDSAEDEEGGDRLPPHELLARQIERTRIASFSVHEGIGRTLKGRDLRTVRNAIWQKTGFED